MLGSILCGLLPPSFWSWQGTAVGLDLIQASVHIMHNILLISKLQCHLFTLSICLPLYCHVTNNMCNLIITVYYKHKNMLYIICYKFVSRKVWLLNACRPRHCNAPGSWEVVYFLSKRQVLLLITFISVMHPFLLMEWTSRNHCDIIYSHFFKPCTFRERAH